MVAYCEKDALIPDKILQNSMKDIKKLLDFFERDSFFQQTQENETSTEQGKTLQDKIFKIKDIFYFYTEDYYPNRIFRYVINEETIGIMVMTKNLPKNSENPTEEKKPFIEIDFLVTHIGSNQCGGILMEKGVNYFCQSADTLILRLDSLNSDSTERYKGLGFKPLEPLEPNLKELVPMSLNLEESEYWIYNGKWCLKNHINKSSYVHSLSSQKCR